jgi:O-antigen/teichoic acid export membrane protein
MSSAPGSSFESTAEPRAKVIPGPDLAHRVVRNTGVLAASQLLVRALGMGLMILLARYLGAEGYGTYQRAEAFVFLFSILANLGLDMILTREVARGTTRTPEYLGGILALKLGLGLLTFAVIQGVAGARGYEGDFLWGIRAFSLVLVLNSLAQAVEATFQGLEVMRYVALANLSTQIVTLVLGVACILSGKEMGCLIV